MSNTLVQSLITCRTQCIFLTDSLIFHKITGYFLVIKTNQFNLILPFGDREHHTEPVDVHRCTDSSIQLECELLVVFHQGYRDRTEHVSYKMRQKKITNCFHYYKYEIEILHLFNNIRFSKLLFWHFVFCF